LSIEEDRNSRIVTGWSSNKRVRTVCGSNRPGARSSRSTSSPLWHLRSTVFTHGSTSQGSFAQRVAQDVETGFAVVAGLRDKPRRVFGG